MSRDRRCSIDGCDRPHLARGLCSRHYYMQRWRQTHPTAGPKTHCKHGHEYTPENTYTRMINGRPRRNCRECRRRQHRESEARRPYRKR